MPVALPQAKSWALPGLVQTGAYTPISEAIPIFTSGTRPPFGQHARNAYRYTYGQPMPRTAMPVSLSLPSLLSYPGGPPAVSVFREHSYFTDSLLSW